MGTTVMPPGVDDRVAQRHKALREANRVKQARTILLRRLREKPSRAGCVMCADLVAEPPDVLDSILVDDLLLSVRKVGALAAERMRDAAGIVGAPRLRELSPCRRSALVALLRVRGGGA